MTFVASTAFTIVTGCGQAAVDELTATDAGAPARVCLAVPGDIAWDSCGPEACQGQFAQTMTRWPYSNNNRDEASFFGDYNLCGPDYVGVDVTASILRCVPGPDDNGDPPTCAQLQAAALILLLDEEAVRTGITCCLRERLDSNQIFGFQIFPSVSQGPQGMCAGSTLNYRFWLPNCGC